MTRRDWAVGLWALILFWTALLVLMQPSCSPTPCLDATRVAAVSQRIGVLETTLPPIGTAVAECLQVTSTCVQNVATSTHFCTLTATVRPTWTPAVTPTPLAECRPCTMASECPSGQTCANCRGVAHFCVPIESINGGCARCLEILFSLMIHSYEGPPEEPIDFEMLRTPSTIRRWGP